MNPAPALTISAPRAIERLRDIAPHYDGFVLDLWGVIHDGQALYPGVLQTLEALFDAGKRVWFLSNAPRRAKRAVEGLKRFGIPDHLYEGVLTSGEMSHALLTSTTSPFSAWGNAYFFIGPERDRDLMTGTSFVESSADKAGFVLNVGFDDDELEIEPYLPLLREAANHRLPMLCANPDRIIVRLDGSPFPCAGLLADAYEAMGGKVTQVGKPYPHVYERVLAALDGLAPSRILAVGDNLDTDILGANRAGLDCLLVTGGVLQHHLGLAPGALPGMAELTPLLDAAGAIPDLMISGFSW